MILDLVRGDLLKGHSVTAVAEAILNRLKRIVPLQRLNPTYGL